MVYAMRMNSEHNGDNGSNTVRPFAMLFGIQFLVDFFPLHCATDDADNRAVTTKWYENSVGQRWRRCVVCTLFSISISFILL